MANKEIIAYLRQYKQQGYSTSELKTQLVKAGFQKSEINEAVREIRKTQIISFISPDRYKILLLVVFSLIFYVFPVATKGVLSMPFYSNPSLVLSLTLNLFVAYIFSCILVINSGNSKKLIKIILLLTAIYLVIPKTAEYSEGDLDSVVHTYCNCYGYTYSGGYYCCWSGVDRCLGVCRVNEHVEEYSSYGEPEPPIPTKEEPITISRETIIKYYGDKIVIKAGIYNTLNHNITPTLNIECNDDIIIVEYYSNRTISHLDNKTITIILKDNPNKNYYPLESKTFECKMILNDLNRFKDFKYKILYSKEDLTLKNEKRINQLLLFCLGILGIIDIAYIIYRRNSSKTYRKSC